MVENLLTGAIREFVAETLKEMVLPNELNGERGVHVFNGYLPHKEPAKVSDDLFPFVVVRADEGESDEDGTLVTVSIIIGVYSEADDGHEFAFNIMSRIRTALTSLPGLVLQGRYQLRYPIKWGTFSEQPYPQWQIDMQTQWLIRTPRPVPDPFEEEI